MSKSLGNFILIKNLLQKHEADVIRLFLISTHYRRPIDFTETDLESVKQRLARIRGTIMNLRERLDSSPELEENGNDEEFVKQIQAAKEKFIDVMDDDFNTPRALAIFHSLIQIGNKALATNLKRSVLSKVLAMVTEMSQVFGILSKDMEKIELPENAKRLLKEREKARNRNDWKKADELRMKLRNMGIILEDLPERTRWSYEK